MQGSGPIDVGTNQPPEGMKRIMKLSSQGMDLLIAREGVRNNAYLDTAEPPVWTIGVGHTGPEVHAGLYWDDAKVREVFSHDVARFEEAVNNSVDVVLDQHQFDALVSFAFNVGIGAFKSSTMLRKINAKLFDEVPAQFDRWNIPPSIITRRNGEREQFKGTHFMARYP